MSNSKTLDIPAHAILTYLAERKNAFLLDIARASPSVLKEQSMYSMILRLQNLGYVEPHEKVQDTKTRVRTPWGITEAGRAALQAHHDAIQAIGMKWPFKQTQTALPLPAPVEVADMDVDLIAPDRVQVTYTVAQAYVAWRGLETLVSLIDQCGPLIPKSVRAYRADYERMAEELLPHIKSRGMLLLHSEEKKSV